MSRTVRLKLTVSHLSTPNAYKAQYSMYTWLFFPIRFLLKYSKPFPSLAFSIWYVVRGVIQTVLFITSSTWLPAGPLLRRSEADSIWAPLCRSASTHQIRQYVWQPRSGHVLISVLHGVLRSTKFNQMTSPLSFHPTINSATKEREKVLYGALKTSQSACLRNEVCTH